MNSPRERILDTAAILFHQQGYNSTGINQIISEAKVAKASFISILNPRTTSVLHF